MTPRIVPAAHMRWAVVAYWEKFSLVRIVGVQKHVLNRLTIPSRIRWQLQKRFLNGNSGRQSSESRE